jgi:hypothetical protein
MEGVEIHATETVKLPKVRIRMLYFTNQYHDYSIEPLG